MKAIKTAIAGYMSSFARVAVGKLRALERAKKAYGEKLGIIEIRSGLVCVRSFFDGPITREYRARRIWTMAAAALCAAFMLTYVLVNSIISVAIYINGEEVGSLNKISDVTKIVSSAEEQLTEILGHEYSLSDSLSLTTNIGTAADGAEDIEKAILSSVEGVTEKYVLLVGGEIAGASDDEAELFGVLSGILDEYSTEMTSSVRFLEEVSVTRQFVSDEVVSDTAEIKSLLTPGASDLSLTVECIESVLYSEETPFETEVIEDETIYEDESRVVTEGKSGIILVTEKVVLINGIEQSRNRVGEVNAAAPVTEVIARGVLERPKTASNGAYIWPAQGTVTSKFGYRNVSIGSSNHKGIDIAGSYGQTIYAADGGEVVFSGWNSSYGYLVRIKHDNGDETLYAHCSGLLVNEGDVVSQGQEIAQMGSTGIASGVHVHFELKVDGVQVNPAPYLS